MGVEAASIAPRDDAPAPTRFVVLTTQRSGSTWLIDLLNSHPHVRAYSELFLDSDQAYPTWGAVDLPLWNAWKKDGSDRVPDYLDRVFSSGDRRTRAVGFKLMYGQAGAHPDVVTYAVERGVRLVHLIRRNSLDALISRVSAVRRDVFHVADPAVTPPAPIRIEPEGLVPELARCEGEVARARRRFAGLGLPYCEVFYEDLCRGSTAGVLDFLGVGPHPLRSRLRKINDAPRRDLVSNFDEIEAVLAPTRFARLLG